jgi:hypothetical protein
MSHSFKSRLAERYFGRTDTVRARKFLFLATTSHPSPLKPANMGRANISVTDESGKSGLLGRSRAKQLSKRDILSKGMESYPAKLRLQLRQLWKLAKDRVDRVPNDEWLQLSKQVSKGAACKTFRNNSNICQIDYV